MRELRISRSSKFNLPQPQQVPRVSRQKTQLPECDKRAALIKYKYAHTACRHTGKQNNGIQLRRRATLIERSKVCTALYDLLREFALMRIRRVNERVPLTALTLDGKHLQPQMK